MVKTVFWILTIALQATALPAWTQSTPYPSRPVRLVVPFPPGGSTDVMARLVAQKLTERWGRAIVVENKPGGGTLIGTDFVARASADGYTALFTAGGVQLQCCRTPTKNFPMIRSRILFT